VKTLAKSERLAPPADPSGDRMSEAIARRHGVDEEHYQEHLNKLERQLNERRIGPGKYEKLPFPAGFKPGQRKRNRYLRPGSSP
jgi:hypothetical protein